MGIKIIDEGDIELTAGELARYAHEWHQATSYSVNPPTLEDYIRGQKRAKQEGGEILVYD